MTTHPASWTWTDEPPIEAGDEPPRSPRRGRMLLILIPIAVLLIVADRITLPYYVVAPGPARDVEPLIEIDDHRTYPSDGRLLLTAVNLSRANVYELIGAWLDPSRAAVPERDIISPGQTPKQEFEAARSEMDTSKIHAAVVALTAYAGYPEERRPGVLIESVIEGSPAEGKLFPGDLIVAIDGRALDGVEDLRSRIDAARPRDTLDLTVEAGDERRHAKIQLGPVPGIEGPAMGISPVDNFPFPLTIESSDIGGPSAGLMWTLGIVELLTPEDLVAGRVVAGTGAIGLDGDVHPVGGVVEKVVAAQRGGASLFFVPIENAAAARSVAEGLTIVPVDSYLDAVHYLERTA